MQAMDRATARAVLGVTESTPWPDVRAAYRRLLLEHHPDHASLATDEQRHARTERTAQFTLAYRALREAPTAHDEVVADQPAPPEPATRASAGADADGGRRLLLDATPEEAYFALVEASHAIGFVSYVDRQNGILEVIVAPKPSEVTSIVIEVSEGPDHSVATLYAEPLGRHAPASLDDFTAELAAKLAAPGGDQR